MKDAALIGFALVTVFAVLSWASAPASVFAERKLRVDAEVKVAALQTQVVRLLPTPTLGIRCPAWPRC